MAPTREDGLLEQPLLHAGPGAGPITAPDGAPAGSSRRLPGGFLAWLLGPSFAVHEAGEEPLVFTARRNWSLLPRWSVLDADGEHAGTVGGLWILDRWGRAWISHSPDGRFRARDGADLGRHEGPTLAFAPASEGDPFARMLMLAAVIVR